MGSAISITDHQSLTDPREKLRYVMMVVVSLSIYAIIGMWSGGPRNRRCWWPSI